MAKVKTEEKHHRPRGTAVFDDKCPIARGIVSNRPTRASLHVTHHSVHSKPRCLFDCVDGKCPWMLII